MSRIIKVGGVDIRMREVSRVAVACDICPYIGKKCKKFKISANESFFDICRSNLVALNECPEPGELEKLNPDKATLAKDLTSIEAIKEYCNNYCLIDCQTNCPLYKFKNEKEDSCWKS